MSSALKFALGGVAVVAIALGGIYLFNQESSAGVGAGPTYSTRPSVAPSGSATPSSDTTTVPAMTEAFTSPWYGYSIRYPASWTVAPASTYFDPVAFALVGGPSPWLDVISPPTNGKFRLASAAIPAGEDGEAWIAMHYGDCAPACQDVVIGGRPARLGADEDQIEATLIAGQRAYVFTLFVGGVLANPRDLFDALVDTVELQPENAQAAPNPSSSSNPSPS